MSDLTPTPTQIHDINCTDLKRAAALCEKADKGIVQLLLHQDKTIESLQTQVAALEDRFISTNSFKCLANDLKISNEENEKLQEQVAALEVDNKRLVDKNLEWLDAWNIQDKQIAALESALNDVLYSGDMSECKDKAEAALEEKT